MKELICIICPKGCHLQVDETNDYQVSGQGCLRGVEYGRTELLHPTRVLTSTVVLKNSHLRRCPVKTSGAIDKHLIFTAMELLLDVELSAPLTIGQTVVADICGSNIDWVVTREVLE